MIKRKILFAIGLLSLLVPVFTNAQNQTSAATPAATASSTDNTLLYIIIALVLTMLFQVVVIRRLIGLISELNYRIVHGKEMPLASEVEGRSENFLSKLFESLTRHAPKGKEKDVMLEHAHDGIYELDNQVPPWLQLILYTTISFGIIYLFVYQVYHIGMSPQQEYAAELQQAADAKAARLKLVGASIDETSVKQMTDAPSLTAGKTIFISRCSPCHGQNGEGNVGPNLTDDYWLHGGTVNDIFKTVKYGVPAKGMVSWQAILKPDEMQNVVSYVMSLHGSNPANAKAPQGVLVGATTAASDSTQAATTDTTKTKP